MYDRRIRVTEITASLRDKTYTLDLAVVVGPVSIDVKGIDITQEDYDRIYVALDAGAEAYEKMAHTTGILAVDCSREESFSKK